MPTPGLQAIRALDIERPPLHLELIPLLWWEEERHLSAEIIPLWWRDDELRQPLAVLSDPVCFDDHGEEAAGEVEGSVWRGGRG